jgi:hypothetical protein
VAAAGESVDGAAQIALDGGVRGGLLQRGRRIRHVGVPVAGDGAPEQLFLAAEHGVQARLVDAHGVGEFAHRGALVAVLPEDMDRPVEGLVLVEGARPSPATAAVDAHESTLPTRTKI